MRSLLTCDTQQLWRIILKFPTSISAAFRERRAKQIEYLKVRQELKETSSQDEFAKWAKLRRKHDKMLEELEKTSTCGRRPLPLLTTITKLSLVDDVVHTEYR